MASIDLHIHSNYSSDGEFTPAYLVELCQLARLTHAAIADHNSVKAIDEAQAAAKRKLLDIIPAIEMDCVFDGVNLHLLGYGIDHTDPIFNEIERDLHRQEQGNSERLMCLVRELGIDFNDDMIATLAFDGVVTGEMIAEAALFFDREGKNSLLDPYRDDGARSDNPYVNFYWDYCSQGKPAYTPMSFISLSQAIDIIRNNHGVPVLAHPGINIKENPALLKAIIAGGIAGIEVYSTYHTRDQQFFYYEAALSNGLLMTCGSDFHGKTKKSIEIGGIDCAGQEKQIISNLVQKMMDG